MLDFQEGVFVKVSKIHVSPAPAPERAEAKAADDAPYREPPAYVSHDRNDLALRLLQEAEALRKRREQARQRAEEARKRRAAAEERIAKEADEEKKRLLGLDESSEADSPIGQRMRGNYLDS